MRRVVLIATLAAVLGAAQPAAAKLVPLGHGCTLTHGVWFCPTQDDSQRVPSFDGVPLDVDVTLPRSGIGPFPTLVLMHGYGGSKTNFESASGADPAGVTYHYNNVYFARRGYAVVTYTARGFGRSCGAPDSRTSPGCDRGWIHFADQRYELRDTQYLLGRLADEGYTDPNRIGVSGVSYGGLQSAQLAFLRNRVRRLDGTFTPWRSPNGKPMRVTAAWMRWASGDLAYSLVPNGRLLSTSTSLPAAPFGVEKQSLLNILYLGGAVTGNIAPRGADPTADLASWRARINAGEPYGPRARAILRQFRVFKGTGRLSGPATPLLLQNGWTDPVFPAQDALYLYNHVRAADPAAPVVLQLGDIGHFTGGEAAAQYTRFNTQGGAFLARYLKDTSGGPAAGSAEVFGQGCPKGQLGLGPISAPYRGLARGSVRFGLIGPKTITSTGGNADTAKAIDPVANQDRCRWIDVDSAPGGVTKYFGSPGFTQVGLPVVRAEVKTSGQFGQIDARLWDTLDSSQRLVDWGVYRLTPNQTGRIVFQLFGNAYRFPKSHILKLELLGRSAPLLRASNGKFSVELRDVRVSVPAREAPSAAAGISKPTRLR